MREIFEILFSSLDETDAEDIWLREIDEYLNSGGEILITNPLNGWGLLHYAAENMFDSVVLMLLKNEIPVDIEASNGSTPYLIALDASIDSAIQYDEDKINFSVVKLLVEHGANIDVCSEDGISRQSLLDNYGERAIEEYISFFEKN